MKIKKGDKVKILTGKDKGKSGSVVRSFPKNNSVLVEGMNMKKVHRRPRKQGEKGKVVDVASPIDVSNVKKI